MRKYTPVVVSVIFILLAIYCGCSRRYATSPFPGGVSLAATPTSTPGYPVETSWGQGSRCASTTANSPRMFLTPCGSTVNSQGYIYIADLGNNRIVKYDASGNYQSAFGGPDCMNSGTGDGQFSSPYGTTIDNNDNIFVADTYNNRIQKFNSSGAFSAKWGSSGNSAGQFNFPMGISADKAGHVFVADTNNNRIQKFDTNGNFLIAWGSNGQGNGQFVSPTAVAVDSAGNYVYVTDSGNHRVQKFDASGNYITQWGGFVPVSGTGLAELAWPPNSSPWGIAVDDSGYVFVCDTANNKIKKYDPSGNFITEIIVTEGYYDHPWGVCVDHTGAVYATCFVGHIIKFSYN